jgi:hypothetical protein
MKAESERPREYAPPGAFGRNAPAPPGCQMRESVMPQIGRVLFSDATSFSVSACEQSKRLVQNNLRHSIANFLFVPHLGQRYLTSSSPFITGMISVTAITVSQLAHI